MNFLPIPLALLLLMGTSLAYALEEGQQAPSCTSVHTDKGTPVDLSAYKGKVVLVDFWATWCGPCQKSMPFLNGLRNEQQDKGFEIIAINVDENSEEAHEFLKTHPVDYVLAFDPTGECPKAYDVKAMPSSYFIDKTGKIRKIHLGFLDSDKNAITQQVSALLAE